MPPCESCEWGGKVVIAQTENTHQRVGIQAPDRMRVPAYAQAWNGSVQSMGAGERRGMYARG